MSKIRTFDDPILQMKCDPVESFEEGQEIVKDLIAELAKCKNGVGLAAPQIGITKRVMIIKPFLKLPAVGFVNPVIESHNNVTKVDIEGCLSYPDVYTEVKRYTYIVIKHLRSDGSGQITGLTQWDARIAQHELDHLDGICYVGDKWRQEQDDLIQSDTAVVDTSSAEKGTADSGSGTDEQIPN